MIIGFTGTREGLTMKQREELDRLLQAIKEDADKKNEVVTGLHGDCIGADSEFDDACIALGIKTTCRPSNMASMRCQSSASEVAPPEHPIHRNKKIVEDSTRMLACPVSEDEVLRSGTWTTIRYAKLVGKPLTIIWPNGTWAFGT